MHQHMLQVFNLENAIECVEEMAQAEERKKEGIKDDPSYPVV